MNTTRASRPSRQGGFALGVALVTLVILTVMGLAIGAMGVQNLSQIRQSGDSIALLHAANGGLHELMDRIYGNGSSSTNGQFGRGVTNASADGSGAYTTSMTGCRYWWTFNTSSGEPYCTNNMNGDTTVTGWNGMRVPARMALLVVSADVVARPGGDEPTRVVAVVTNGFPYAIASDGTVEVSDVRSVIPGRGNVRSNNNSGTASNPNIQADSVDGMTFSRNGPGTIDISGSAGPELFNQPPVPLPNIPIDQIVASQSTAGTGGSHPYGGPATFQIPGPGPYDISNRPDGSLEIGGVRIHPVPASVYVEGGIRSTGGGSTTIPQGIHLFVHGDMVVNGSLRQETTPAPGGGSSSSGLPNNQNFLFVTGDLRFNGAEGPALNLLAGGNIRQNGTSNFTGLVYARDGTVDFNGSGTVTGSIIARAGVNSGAIEAQSLDIVFDPKVLNTVSWLNFGITGLVRTTSWYPTAR